METKDNTLTEDAVRAHNEDGTFKADDPTTPDVNEAYEKPTGDTGSEILDSADIVIEDEVVVTDTAVVNPEPEPTPEVAKPKTKKPGGRKEKPRDSQPKPSGYGSPAAAPVAKAVDRPIHPSVTNESPLNPGIQKRLAMEEKAKRDA